MSADEQRKLAAIMFTICLDHVRLNIYAYLEENAKQ